MRFSQRRSAWPEVSVRRECGKLERVGDLMFERHADVDPLRVVYFVDTRSRNGKRAAINVAVKVASDQTPTTIRSLSSIAFPFAVAGIAGEPSRAKTLARLRVPARTSALRIVAGLGFKIAAVQGGENKEAADKREQRRRCGSHSIAFTSGGASNSDRSSPVFVA